MFRFVTCDPGVHSGGGSHSGEHAFHKAGHSSLGPGKKPRHCEVPMRKRPWPYASHPLQWRLLAPKGALFKSPCSRHRAFIGGTTLLVNFKEKKPPELG